VKPTPKYAVAALLHRAGSQGAWEHELFNRLRPLYEPVALEPMRDDLVGLVTLGWLDTVEEREVGGQLVRRYALSPAIRPFLEYQLDLPRVERFLDGVPA
jgi:hypothetical protein